MGGEHFRHITGSPTFEVTQLLERHVLSISYISKHIEAA